MNKKASATKAPASETAEQVKARVLGAEKQILQILESTNTKLDVRVVLRENSVAPIVTVVSK